MRCMNIACALNDKYAENSCTHVVDPSYITCRKFHTVGYGDATTHEALKNIVDPQHFKYLDKLFARIGREGQLLHLTKDDQFAIKDLFPSIYTVLKNLKGD